MAKLANAHVSKTCPNGYGFDSHQNYNQALWANLGNADELTWFSSQLKNSLCIGSNPIRATLNFFKFMYLKYMYKCNCGKKFEKSGSLNSHARFCDK